MKSITSNESGPQLYFQHLELLVLKKYEKMSVVHFWYVLIFPSYVSDVHLE